MRLTNSIEQQQDELARLEESGADAKQLAWHHFTLAISFLRKQEYEPAVEHLRKSVAYEGSNAVVRAYLGAALLEEYQVDEAKEQLELALELAPDEMLVHLKLGEFKYKLGFYPEAVTHLEAAAKLQAPNRATAQYLVELLEKVRHLNKNVIVRDPKAPNFKKLSTFFNRLSPRSKNTQSVLPGNLK